MLDIVTMVRPSTGRKAFIGTMKAAVREHMRCD